MEEIRDEGEIERLYDQVLMNQELTNHDREMDAAISNMNMFSMFSEQQFENNIPQQEVYYLVQRDSMGLLSAWKSDSKQEANQFAKILQDKYDTWADSN